MRSNKAEEEVAELVKKSTQLEVELDKTKEQLVMMIKLRGILMRMMMMILTLFCTSNQSHCETLEK